MVYFSSSKKAQVSIQFNWVFAVIIGAVILSFFIIVIQKQKKSSDLELANELLSDMDLILAGQSVSVGREDLMEIPNKQILFGCDEYSIMDMTKQKGNAIIFSPNNFESDRMLAWTLTWDMPFKITNFVYLTTPDIKYYLIYSNKEDIGPDSAGEYIINNFPENLQLKALQFGDIDKIPENKNQIRLIFLNMKVIMPSDLTGSRDQDVTALKIVTSDINYLDDANLEFYIKRGNQFFLQDGSNNGILGGVYPAFGVETVFGAMFSNDINLYHCVMQKALKRMGVVAYVYNTRANKLHYLASSECKDYYEPVFDAFIYSNAGGIENIDSGSLRDFQQDVFRGIDTAEDYNIKTVLGSCSTLY